MEGSIFVMVLDDLRREGMMDEAAKLEAAMRASAEVWSKLPFPYGSEMPWDSAGQEEVYAWSRFFGMNEKAQVTLDAITSYMPAHSQLGLQRQRPAFLRFSLRRKIRTTRTAASSLRLRPQRHSGL